MNVQLHFDNTENREVQLSDYFSTFCSFERFEKLEQITIVLLTMMNLHKHDNSAIII